MFETSRFKDVSLGLARPACRYIVFGSSGAIDPMLVQCWSSVEEEGHQTARLC